MNVTLKIENDAELRHYIKELIKEQIKSIAREEIKEIIKDVLSKKVTNLNTNYIEFLIKEEISYLIVKTLNSKGYDGTPFIKEEAKKAINNYIKDALKNNEIV